MSAVTIEQLNEKLKNAPQSVLARVLGYVEALIESTPKQSLSNYTLSNQQQQILDNQVNDDKSQYISADQLHNDLQKKHGL